MIRQKFLLLGPIIGGLLLPILLLNGFDAFSDSFGIQEIHTKKEAPSFSLKDLDGKEIPLSEMKGKPFLLFFWGSFCPACKEDIVLLQKFARQMKDELRIFTIAVDGEKEKRVRRIVRDLHITLPVLLDPGEKIARLYGVRMIPTAFLIDQEGVLRGRVVGQRDWCKENAFLEIKAFLNLR